jgi:phage gp46-like protein
MPLDIALAYNPAIAGCDVVFNGTDFAVDTTFATPVFMALGCQRRAHPDDALPSARTQFAAQVSPLNPERGWAGDFIDPLGELTGSRQWILQGMKHLESTRALAISIDTEALTPLSKRYGISIEIDVQWLNKNTLAHRYVVGGQKIVLPQVVGQ